MGAICLNSDELTALGNLPPLYFQLYVMGLRTAMNYGNGMVGDNGNGYITWETLAKKLTPTRRKGGLYLAPTSSQIKRGINALEKCGLVIRKSTKTHLLFYLPLAEINAPLNDTQNSPTNAPPVVVTVADVARAPANEELVKRPPIEPPKRQDKILAEAQNKKDLKKKEKKNTTYVVFKKEKEKRRSQLPQDFAVKETHVKFSTANGCPHPETEIDAFKDYHHARGTVMLDWDKAFYTWLRNAKKWQGGKGYARNAFGEGLRKKSSIESFWEFFGSESNTAAAFDSQATCTGGEIAV